MDDLWIKSQTLLVEFATTFGVKLLSALGTLVLGWLGINIVLRWIRAALVSKRVDPSLHGFLTGIASWILRVALLITVAEMMGVQMVSFVAVLGAMGFAVGMALQGSLSNFAGGVLILLLRPFRVGDFVEMQGFSGVVHEIQIFHTVLKTGDNKTIVLPNGPVANGSVVNFTRETKRRVDMTFGIGYGDDIATARRIILRILDEDPRVQKDPAPVARVAALADSSVNFTVRCWAESKDYWDVFFETTEKVKLAFDAEGVTIPYPQRDIHLHKVE